MLGLIAHDMGKNDIVVDLISRAVDIDPDYVDAYNSLGNVLRIAGRLDESVASFQKAHGHRWILARRTTTLPLYSEI